MLKLTRYGVLLGLLGVALYLLVGAALGSDGRFPSWARRGAARR